MNKVNDSFSYILYFFFFFLLCSILLGEKILMDEHEETQDKLTSISQSISVLPSTNISYVEIIVTCPDDPSKDTSWNLTEPNQGSSFLTYKDCIVDVTSKSGPIPESNP